LTGRAAGYTYPAAKESKMIDEYTGKKIVSPLDLPHIQSIADETMNFIKSKTGNDIFYVNLVLDHVNRNLLTVIQLSSATTN